jgi:Baseplate J-like protein
VALYVVVPNPRSPDEVATLAFQYLQARLPRWVPNAGALATIILETSARESGELWQLASEVEDAIFRQFGPLVGIDPVEASTASVPSTWTLVDNQGYTIQAGTQVGIRTAGDTLVPFSVDSTVVVAPGSTTTGPGEVTLVAQDAGSAASGLGGPGFPGELIDVLPWVDSIALTALTTGGTDAESDEDYLNRLATELRLLTPRPILPDDFAVLAREVPGVARSLALDLYDPATDTWNNERMVTVCLINEGGYPVNTSIKDAVDAKLEAMREINFVVNEMDPTYTTVDVATTFRAYDGYDPADVVGGVIASLTSYLSPANWGVPPDGDFHSWTNVTVVRYLELAALIDRVAGVDYITSLFVGSGAAQTYAVAASTDRLTISAHGYASGDPLVVTARSGGDPIVAPGLYYVRDVTTNDFKLAAVAGGPALNITSDGTGTVRLGGVGDLTLTGVVTLPQPGAISAAVG